MIEIAIAGRGRRRGVVCIFENTFAGSAAALLRRTKFALPCLNFERPFRRQMADAAKRLEAADTFDEDLHSRR
ncbi:hypothetical protein ACVIW2_001048 [Bradyrhizobium huanghuaihaiense]|uniref:hypothetical protein n=1 Tax=Bradyrhizobium huanghuaihaiense TaxID=990078 RepID=UPI00142EDF67|nr:hypothetical protein [Bradyrhizobium huanghuaihaiense]